jgi:hypothetical protein
MSRLIVNQQCSPRRSIGSAENRIHRTSPDFRLHGELKVTNESLALSESQRTLTRRRIRIESDLKGAFSDDFIARIAGQRNEAVVDFKNDGVRNPD